MSDSELLHEPNAVRRLEVFTGAGRRRRWTAEQKARIVAETYASGESVCAVARRYGLTQQQLFGWRRDARQRAATGEPGLSFAPVIVEATPPCPNAAKPAVSAGAIEIIIGTTMVRVPPGTDMTALATVLRAVKAVS
jgi:transposase